ncbi:hypothetical protein Back11_59090 [Paenibacillus baekrokdamisoli]|uniref:Copper amine oxidase-like N-terminal domain-containing protein n=1 Tax=Paenibacillus baekrokdamisoli TaxID=1712516 RepID=A0A3G9JNY2_9BACL|nr:copper amine oxidase N-terminal domain-containing protein [Paenibacillus baekrokdamisoli]MBB3071402.1 hypothetical protein [Paenibacillus baekrokdamisoli]BBH24564.1 hypothetical protein Back11_59090 [Paenibacillus baekrokdamisoli]
MKKKVIGLTIAGLVALSGVVSAASLWGTYKGNDIIRLTVGGKQTKVTDVPAISYNGRTMVPLYLLSQAGITATWDGKNKTVDIAPSKSLDEAAIREIPVSWLQLYTSASDIYVKWDEFGSDLQYLHRTVSSAMDYAVSGTGENTLLSGAKGDLVTDQNLYNTLVSDSKDVNVDLDSNDLTSDFDQLASQYKLALDHYKNALAAIDRYSKSKNDADYKLQSSEIALAWDIIDKQRKVAWAGYEEYKELIFSFK